MTTYPSYDDIPSTCLRRNYFGFFDWRCYGQPLSLDINVLSCVTFWRKMLDPLRYLGQTRIIPIDIEYEQKDWTQGKADATSDKSCVHPVTDQPRL